MPSSTSSSSGSSSPTRCASSSKGRFELVHLGGMTIGRATYQPGWKWSEHVGAALGADVLPWSSMSAWSCRAARPRRWTTARVIEMRAGDIFYIPPGHDSWVVGDEPYVSLHFLGAEDYARTTEPFRSRRVHASCPQS